MKRHIKSFSYFEPHKLSLCHVTKLQSIYINVDYNENKIYSFSLAKTKTHF